MLAGSTLLAELNFRCDTRNPSTQCLFSLNDGVSVMTLILDPGQIRGVNDHWLGMRYCATVIPKNSILKLNWPACWGNSGYRRVHVAINTE